MTTLFIDSTYDITLGILDDGLGWIDFNTFYGQKASAIIQREAYQMLSKHNLSIQNVASIVTVAGPGFYTGLRLSEGFADVLHFSGVDSFSFLSYDIPRWVGVSSGIWMTKAYRGEYFFHLWSSNESQNKLVAAKDLGKFLDSVDKSQFYIHSESSIDDFSRQFLPEKRHTCLELLKTEFRSIFSHIFNTRPKVDSFYFRAPEDEFKVSI